MTPLVTEQHEFGQCIASLVTWCAQHGWLVTFGEAYRTAEQQEIYVKTGRSKTMQSNHLRRLAMDFNFFQGGELVYDKERLQPIGDFWESLSPQNSWGGNWASFKDVPHFERRVP